MAHPRVKRIRLSRRFSQAIAISAGLRPAAGESATLAYLGVTLRMATAANPGWRGVPKRRSVAWTWTPFGGSDRGVTVQAGYWEKSRKARNGSVSDARRMAASFSG